MRALILWSNPTSTNLGVRALAAGTAELVRRTFGEADISYQGYGPGDSPVRIGDPRRLARRLVTPKDELISWLREFDLVVDTRAGDSFADIYGIKRHLTMSLVHEAVLRARTPLVMGPQTVGPFDTRRGRTLARRTLRTAGTVMARDDRSAAVARQLGAKNVVLTTDVVFALGQPEPDPVRRDVLLNVSGLLWEPNPHVDHVAYQTTVRGLIAWLQGEGREVAVLAHVLDSPVADNDVPAVRQVAGEFGLDTVIPDDLEGVRAAAASSSVLIGSRMHACLNALSVGTPAVPLAYSRKFAPLLDQVGWSHTVDLRAPGSALEQVQRILGRSDLGSDVAHVRASTDDLTASARRALLSAI